MPDADDVVDERSRRKAPRLGTDHFILWMSMNGVLLVIYQYIEPIANLPSDRQLFTTFIHIGHSMIHGAAIAGVLLCVMPTRRRSSYPVLPGHWLLIAMGVALAPFLVLKVVNANYLETIDEYSGMLTLKSRRIFYASLITYLAVSAVVYGIAAKRISDPTRWFAPFVLACLFSSTELSEAICKFAAIETGWFELPARFDLIQTLTVSVAVIFAVAIDSRLKESRDILHWVGITMFLGRGVLYFCWEVNSWLTAD